ncbi:MAG: DNA repair protein RadA [Bacteroidales bacterium]|nr:DNA repair protein RadA [Bacteroidales bacterium]MDD2385879.1 DNA repair protein RadA [Bacteroidales bacterium]MDD4216559.1 DNA repair protein RadA [Bacteroidales bacterium]
MAKDKTVFVCQNCGYISPKWAGKCSNCNSWNSFIEEIRYSEPKGLHSKSEAKPGNAIKISEIRKQQLSRIELPYSEFNRVLGGGLVPGSLVLLGGEPGIGKSTLVLQTVLNLDKRKVLYVSGEESENQIKLRAERIGINNENCFIYTETNIEKIIATIKSLEPEIIVIDSVQTVASADLTSSPGTVSQIRECTRILQEHAKEFDVPVILIGHINKDGDIAGPMSLEHIVDAVFQFEGDNNHYYRLLRPKKNRFGSTYEIGVFEMLNHGLKEITDPGNILLTGDNSGLSGVAYGTIGEGTRTLMIEIQTLIGNAVYSSPQRTSTGFDGRRFQMLLAVIEKKLGLNLSQKDAFVNIAGGIKVSDTAADLPVLASVISSYYDKPIPENTCFIGELGLSGQVRPVSFIDKRVGEARRLGFNNVFISSAQKSELNKNIAGIISVSDVKEFASKLFRPTN